MLEHAGAQRTCRRHRAAGFTLIELMVTLVVLGVVMAIAVPSFTGMINSSRLATQANDLMAGIKIARSEAVRLNRPVTFCGSTNGTTCAAAGSWNQWLVMRADGTVLHTGAINAPIQVWGDVTALNFRSDGLARNANGTVATTVFRACLPTTRPVENQRAITISGGSRANVTSVNGQGACQ